MLIYQKSTQDKQKYQQELNTNLQMIRPSTEMRKHYW
jgi:hypothetical protein